MSFFINEDKIYCDNLPTTILASEDDPQYIYFSLDDTICSLTSLVLPNHGPTVYKESSITNASGVDMSSKIEVRISSSQIVFTLLKDLTCNVLNGCTFTVTGYYIGGAYSESTFNGTITFEGPGDTKALVITAWNAESPDKPVNNGGKLYSDLQYYKSEESTFIKTEDQVSMRGFFFLNGEVK